MGSEARAGTFDNLTKRKLEHLLGMASGYVLDFSNNTFADFIETSVGFNPYSRYEGSKANILRDLWRTEPTEVVVKLTRELLEHSRFLDEQRGPLSAERRGTYTELGDILNALGPDQLGEARQTKAPLHPPVAAPFKLEGCIRLFLSHVTAHKELVHHVKRYLSRYGVDAFVAHDDIEPGAEWEAVIQRALSDCDAIAVFLHEGVKTSNWCDQEIGWTISRGVPILPLRYDLQPYGFMARFQSHNCHLKPPSTVATMIADYLSKHDQLSDKAAESLTRAFVGSRNWDQTRDLAKVLSNVAHFTDDQLDRIERAAEHNVEISTAGIDRMNGPDWVNQFVRRHRPGRV